MVKAFTPEVVSDGQLWHIAAMIDPVFKPPRGRRSRRLWQELVDMAHAALALDACRQYGLITGGPKCNHERCYQMLEEGRSKGIHPSPDAVERFIAAVNAAEERTDSSVEQFY